MNATLKDDMPAGMFLRRDASFTELYELILYNETLIRTECELLRKLLEVKISEKRPPGPVREADWFSADQESRALFGWG